MEDLKRIPAWMASTYIIVLGLLYSVSYWRSFNINVFEYATIGDLGATAAYSLILATIPMVIGATLSYFSAEPARKADHANREFSAPKTTRKRFWQDKFLWVLSLLIIFVALIIDSCRFA